MKNKRLIIGIISSTLALFVLLIFSGAICFHKWKAATCIELATCENCGRTKGNLSTHNWVEPTCTSPRKCKACGKVEGGLLPHQWIDATCQEPKTCEVCGVTDGETIPHQLVEATCTEFEHCIICGTYFGDEYKHNNLSNKGFCLDCGENVGVDFDTFDYSEYFDIQVKVENQNSANFFTQIGEMVDGSWKDGFAASGFNFYINLTPKQQNFKMNNVEIKGNLYIYIQGLGYIEGSQRTITASDSDGNIINSTRLDDTIYFMLENHKINDIKNFFICYDTYLLPTIVAQNATFGFQVTDVYGTIKFQ